MGSWFSTPKPKPSPKARKKLGKGGASAQLSGPERARFQLKATKKNLSKYKKKLEKEIESNKNRAREMIRKKRKDKALFFLKVNKFKTKKIGQLEDQMLNLVTMVEDLKSSEDNLSVFEAMKAGNDELKKIQKQMPIEEVQRVMDESAESAELMDEISSVLGADADGVDDAAVMAEFKQLEDIEAAEIAQQLPQVPSTKLPTVEPAKVPAAATATQEPVSAQEPVAMLA